VSVRVPRRSLASRLATLYTVLFALTVLLVIVASSIALVYELTRFAGDVVLAKHQEARILTDEYRADHLTLAQAAPKIAQALGGIGLRVTVYDDKGRYLAGDRALRPHLLDRIVSGQFKLVPHGPPRGPTQASSRSIHERIVPAPGPEPVHVEPWPLTPVDGGFVAFAPSPWIIFTNLIPYWWIIFGIAVISVVVSWLVGRLFARQALMPMNEVTGSLRALAEGDYTQRRFVTVSGDEIATLTEAYNDAAASVAAAMDERRSTEARMRQFVSDAGHELRTPLTVIAGYIDVLRRGAIEEPNVARQILSTMAIEKEHMRGLIDRLMRLARMDAETPPQLVAIDVGTMLRDQCQAAKRLDEQREIDYRVDGAGEIVADKAELSEALWNVVENALKYAPGAPVHLRARRENGSTVLSVSDEGPGMSEAERVHAFERFYRGDARGEIPGTGLGLAIAKRAVERAGGTIDIDSAPGRGTTVSIRI
jgi:signal transduction histidine kinase